MDPEKCLADAELALKIFEEKCKLPESKYWREDDESHYFLDEMAKLLNSYVEWRYKGGFEPKDGQKRLDFLGNRCCEIAGELR